MTDWGDTARTCISQMWTFTADRVVLTAGLTRYRCRGLVDPVRGDGTLGIYSESLR